MNTKLTLRLDSNLIKFAKQYSAKTGKPLSRIVADLFIIIKNETLKDQDEFTPIVNSLRGILKKSNISEKDYKKYLEEKYL
ncbi:DUF6364 family protein [Desulfonauticus submarinus]